MCYAHTPLAWLREKEFTMKNGMSYLIIKFNGETFNNVNKIIADEEERLKTVSVLYSKMGDVYEEVFKTNPNIVLESKKIFGDIIIDDNHIVIFWNVFGKKIKFYFEQYWGIIELSIETENSGITIQEIVKAFENYYSKKLWYEVKTEKIKDSAIFQLSIYDTTA